PKAALTGILVVKQSVGDENYYTVSAHPQNATSIDAHASNIFQILIFAVLGGLILNLMPCVFPILAMKALSIAKLSGAARHHVRNQALFYMLGVLAAFAGLVGISFL